MNIFPRSYGKCYFIYPRPCRAIDLTCLASPFFRHVWLKSLVVESRPRRKIAPCACALAKTKGHPSSCAVHTTYTWGLHHWRISTSGAIESRGYSLHYIDIVPGQARVIFGGNSGKRGILLLLIDFRIDL